MPDETEKLKARITDGITYLDGIRPSRFCKADVKNFFVFLDLVEEYMKGKMVSSPRINKAVFYFKGIDQTRFNVATWFYVRHFAGLIQKYLNGGDIGTLVPVQLDNFEFAKELFDAPLETTQASA